MNKKLISWKFNFKCKLKCLVPFLEFVISKTDKINRSKNNWYDSCNTLEYFSPHSVFCFFSSRSFSILFFFSFPGFWLGKVYSRFNKIRKAFHEVRKWSARSTGTANEEIRGNWKLYPGVEPCIRTLRRWGQFFSLFSLFLEYLLFRSLIFFSLSFLSIPLSPFFSFVSHTLVASWCYKAVRNRKTGRRNRSSADAKQYSHVYLLRLLTVMHPWPTTKIFMNLGNVSLHLEINCFIIRDAPIFQLWNLFFYILIIREGIGFM